MARKLTEAQLAAALALSVRHLRRLVARGMPTNSLAAAQRWHQQNVAGRVRAAGDLLTARTELARAQADRIRQKRLAADESLIEAAEVRRILAQCHRVHSDVLKAVEERIKARYPDLPPAASDFLRAEIDAALALIDPDTVCRPKQRGRA